MADEILKRDNNGQPVIGLVTDDANQYIKMGRIDNATKGLKVMLVGGSLGTVSSVSVVSANGFAGTVATATTTPAITISTTVTGILIGNGTSISAAGTTGSGQIALATSPTFQTSINGAYLDNSEILGTDGSKNIVSLPVAIYPSLTELSYVKGVTSAIQTQINSKGAGIVTAVSVATANGVSGTSSGGATPALTISLGAITPTTVNKVTITAPATGSTLTIADGKTATFNGTTITGTTGILFENNGGITMVGNKVLTINKTLTFDGTDATTMTFPTTSKTIAANDGSNLTISGQAIGDIPVASSTTAYGKLADVAVGQVLTSGGVGAAPVYSATPAVTNLIEGFRTQATAGGTTVLTIADAKQQYFTGTSTQTVTLPTTSIVAGQSYLIVNNSTLVVTVQSSGANTILAIPTLTTAIFTALVVTPTTAANWAVSSYPNTPGGGGVAATDVQKFGTSSTSGSFTWTKPTNAKMVTVYCIGAGGGSSGGGGNGGGGGGGALTFMTFDASLLGATETVIAGAHGNGGNPGTAGGNSSFGTWLIAGGGGFGGNGFAGHGGGALGPGSPLAGTGTNGIGGQGGLWTNATTNGGCSEYGGGSGGGGGNSANSKGGSSIYGAGGGGFFSQDGGTSGTYTAGGGGAGGGTNGTNGADGTTLHKMCGAGGGGGGSSAGNTGGVGGFPGGGAGGAYNGQNGANGQVIVTTYF